jgi:hypothetical protein
VSRDNRDNRQAIIEWGVGLAVLASVIAAAAFMHLPPPHLNEHRSVFHGHGAHP